MQGHDEQKNNHVPQDSNNTPFPEGNNPPDLPPKQSNIATISLDERLSTSRAAQKCFVFNVLHLIFCNTRIYEALLCSHIRTSMVLFLIFGNLVLLLVRTLQFSCQSNLISNTIKRNAQFIF